VSFTKVFGHARFGTRSATTTGSYYQGLQYQNLSADEQYQVAGWVNQLPPLARRVISLHWGLDTPPTTLGEIARDTGLTEQAARSQLTSIFEWVARHRGIEPAIVAKLPSQPLTT
jgi:hypothetical protein